MMKNKVFSLFLFLGFVLPLLGGCKRIEQPKITTEVTRSEDKKTPPVSSSSSEQEVKVEQVRDLKAEEEFVQKFLEAYTNYSSLNAQKAAIQSFLTNELKEKLAVGQVVSPDLNRVTSKGERLSVWHNEEEWLGLVTIKINEQTSNVQVFVIGLEIKEGHYLVQGFQSPTQK